MGLLIAGTCAAGCAAGSEGGEAWSTKGSSAPPALNEPPAAGAVGAGAVGSATAGSMRAAAEQVLLEALESGNPLLRANAIEALEHAPALLEAAVRRGLVDENRGVRFVAAMTIGRERLTGVAHLLEPLLDDPSDSVRAAAIYGLQRNGFAVDPSPLAAMLKDQSPEVKANAALVLGELGNRSAVPMLRSAMGRGLELADPARARLVDMQIAEALVRLGVASQIEGIRAALYAPPEQGELTALACLMCGRLGDRRVMTNLFDLATRTGRRQQSPEVRMAAVMALAELDRRRAPIEVPLEFVGSERFEVRSQAALTLGALRDPAAAPALGQLLDDPNPLVQVSAAAAVCRLSHPEEGPGTGA